MCDVIHNCANPVDSDTSHNTIAVINVHIQNDHLGLTAEGYPVLI